MKVKLILAFLTAATATAAVAGPPKADVHLEVTNPTPMQKVAWLGITTREAPPVIASQLDLPKGTGLVVDMVIPESPAAAAGILANDVLTKLDDQILINPPQLAVLVRIKNAGDRVQLTLLRKGKTQTVSATLGEREVPDMPAFHALPDEPNAVLKEFGFIPMQGGIEGPSGGAWVTPNTPGSSVIIQGMSGDGEQSFSTSKFSDGAHSITVEVRKGTKTVTIRDHDGKLIYTGPHNTDEDKAKIPADVRPKIEQMENTQKRIPMDMLTPAPQSPGPM
jgi:serine protease Do